jgi:hypothetical protein
MTREEEAARLLGAIDDYVRGAVERAQQVPPHVTQHCCAPLSKGRFLDLCRAGELPCRKDGKLRIVERQDFERYLASRPRVQRIRSRQDATADSRSLDERIASELGAGPRRSS